MSTTFEVYPRNADTPSYNDLLVLGEKRLHEQLKARSIQARPVLTMELRRHRSHELLEIDRSSPFRWDEESYLWLSFIGHSGGTDVCCETLDFDEDLDTLAELLAPDKPQDVTRSDAAKFFPAGIYWRFRRSAGQPALINFAYGILAATLAELTHGIISTLDSAWDAERFPATAESMYSWYFVPEKAIDPDYGHWAHSCLDAIARQCDSA